MDRININGTNRRVISGTVGAGQFTVDTPENPGTACQAHKLTAASAYYIENGGTVKTSGCTYTRAQDKE